jgi:hypothetical protein
MQKEKYSFDYLFKASNKIGRESFTIEDIERMAKVEDERNGEDTINYHLTK